MEEEAKKPRGGSKGKNKAGDGDGGAQVELDHQHQVNSRDDWTVSEGWW